MFRSEIFVFSSTQFNHDRNVRSSAMIKHSVHKNSNGGKENTRAVVNYINVDREIFNSKNTAKNQRRNVSFIILQSIIRLTVRCMHVTCLVARHHNDVYIYIDGLFLNQFVCDFERIHKRSYKGRQRVQLYLTNDDHYCQLKNKIQIIRGAKNVRFILHEKIPTQEYAQWNLIKILHQSRKRLLTNMRVYK